MLSWYLVQFRKNSHLLAQKNLNRQKFKTFLPLQDYTSRSGPKFLTRTKPLFPGYMFVSIELDLVPWYKINNTRGVSRIICEDGKPKKVPQEIVHCLMSRCDLLGKLLPSTTLERGDPVVVAFGALADFVATVETIDSDERIWVLMDIMGHSTKVQLNTDQLRPLN